MGNYLALLTKIIKESIFLEGGFFNYLKEKLTLISIFFVYDDTIPKSICASIEKSEQESENDLIDFNV